MSYGVITKEYTVWCAICEEWHQESGYSSAKQFAKRCGYKKVKGLYVCPSCEEGTTWKNRIQNQELWDYLRSKDNPPSAERSE